MLTVTLRLTNAAAFLLALWGVWIMVLALSQGYSREEMDWNNDGKTTLVEIWDRADIRKRTIEKDGKVCDEYFRFKDGNPLKVVCG